MKTTFFSTIRLSYFRFSLLLINTVISIFFVLDGYLHWSVFVIIFIVFVEVFHVVDVILKKSFISLEGDILTVKKWPFGTLKKYDLTQYDNLKGRQKNGNIINLVAINTDNPKDYFVVFNIYKSSLNELYLIIADMKGLSVSEEQ